jgi:DNA-binding NarL/FixJ family response regulator
VPDQLEFRSDDYSWLFASRPPRPRPLPERIRVLIVDDHALFAEALSVTLGADRRFDVVGRAADGIEAIDLAGELKPDVILMDLHMPRLDGVEATRAIRSVSPSSLVVVVSAGASAGMVQQAYDAGAVGYVGKDRASDELTATLLKVARLGRPFGVRLLLDDPETEPERLLARSA